MTICNSFFWQNQSDPTIPLRAYTVSTTTYLFSAIGTHTCGQIVLFSTTVLVHFWGKLFLKNAPVFHFMPNVWLSWSQTLPKANFFQILRLKRIILGGFCLHFVSKVLKLGKVADKDGTWQLLGQFLPRTNGSSAKKKGKKGIFEKKKGKKGIYMKKREKKG